ncbi:MAG: NAD kinase [Nocardioidaceae bacterium]
MSTADKPRTVLLTVHTGRPEAVDVARAVVKRLLTAGIAVRLLDSEAAAVDIDGTEAWPSTPQAAEGCEINLVIGGDGTILRGAELTRETRTPLLGINLGHVGFLAEAEWDDLDSTVDAIVHRTYAAEERMTIEVTVLVDGVRRDTGWALNEVSVEKASRQRMLELIVEIDDRPLSRWGCDGVIFATPTGSTAYAFSAGGPVVWPEVEALLLAPISAHALFARPMVTSPHSTLAVEMIPGTEGQAVLWCDGRRMIDLEPGSRIEVRRGPRPVVLARLHTAPFADRLVAKFDLPVTGWRGAAERRRQAREDT